MKAVLLVASVHIASGMGHRGPAPRVAALFSKQTLKAVVDPEDQARCVKKVKGFLKEPQTKALAIDAATDNCAVAKMDKARNYVCPHVKTLLTDAFKEFPKDKKMDADKFCDMSEFHTLRMRGATRVPNVGKGSLLNYTISKTCEKTTLAAMKPAKKLKAAEIPDFWYSLCLNQDCAHLLPSRTKWCKVDRTPTHGIEVCTLMREYAAENAGDSDGVPKSLCKLYDNFVDHVKADVEAYDHYVHGRSREHVPVPDSKTRALNSAKMANDVNAHKLRDGKGKQVKPAESGAPAASVATVLAFLALAA